jgi:hypothetical protein
LLALLFGCFALAASARADAIQKWRTPGGSLYFGDRPPLGSTLLDTIADGEAAATPAPTTVESDLSRAAADGREIMRRRAAERAEERRLDAERAARLEVLEAADQQLDGLPFLIIDTFPGRRPGAPWLRPRRDTRWFASLDARRTRRPWPSFGALAPPLRPPAPFSRGFMPSGKARGARAG